MKQRTFGDISSKSLILLTFLFLLFPSFSQAEKQKRKIVEYDIYISRDVKRPDLIKRQFRKVARKIESKIKVKIKIASITKDVINEEAEAINYYTHENLIPARSTESWRRWYAKSPYLYTGENYRFALFIQEAPKFPYGDPIIVGGAYRCSRGLNLSNEYHIAHSRVTQDPFAPAIDFITKKPVKVQKSSVFSYLVMMHEILHNLGAFHDDEIKPNVMQTFFKPWLTKDTKFLKITNKSIAQINACLSLK